ncbi:MAG: BolA family transcriptional regulator [Alphaproteobacteria bacterium]|nr:BolA family transcriptional regulator [Alphaproteobacteria bacterium]MCD8526430.1 BolA family transcriptional regulator [Alphaproteobacteria bacterium]MCD8571378.1 BolA family transcriptional regulator [Alphaproteobacteria bacterium]
MSMDNYIKERITETLLPSHMELVNESARHKGHAGDDGSGETHYNLLVVSACFEGQSRVARQRLVYDALKDAFDRGLHALSAKCLTEKEFDFQNRK